MKNDKYKKSRGGWSRMLDICCEHCGSHICFYQKDGPGLLKRMYYDRISGFPTKSNQLVCTKCNSVLGIGNIYEKEHRPAYRLFVGSITKKIVKGDSKWMTACFIMVIIWSVLSARSMRANRMPTVLLVLAELAIGMSVVGLKIFVSH